MAEALYIKRGRKYEPWGTVDEAWTRDAMKVGECHMTYCYEPGARFSRWGVTPDTASFVAAAEIARAAMEAAMRERAIGTPQLGEPVRYTRKQLALIEKFRQDMAATGALMPTHWSISYPADIAQAGIDAVRGWKPA